MLFKVTHIGPTGHRRKAHVSCSGLADALEQVDQAFGPARAVACVRVVPRTTFRLVKGRQAGLPERRL